MFVEVKNPVQNKTEALTIRGSHYSRIASNIFKQKMHALYLGKIDIEKRAFFE